MGILAMLMPLVSLTACGSGAGASSADGSGRASAALPKDVSYSREADVAQYRADLDALAKRTGNDFLSAIIADNTITADEMNEAKRRMQQCYSDLGYKAVQTDDSGGIVVVRADGGDVRNDGNALTAADKRCQTDSGYAMLTGIYFNAVRNPDRLDLVPYTVRCLIDHGIVDPSYTVQDYQRDSQNRNGPYKVQDEDPEGTQGRQVTQCGRDPLGKLG
ncbi:hypothetical protein DSM100685_0574 [Bifidobacterium avesanii]|nr:hypothetical protein DSM100685_0574 [Bifidobacterium avesanii]